MLSLVLMHKPLRHPGMPKGLAHQLASPSLTNIPEASDVGSITLALRTLGSFEFEGKNPFEICLHYLFFFHCLKQAKWILKKQFFYLYFCCLHQICFPFLNQDIPSPSSCATVLITS